MQILRTSAVAAKCGVHPRTVWRWSRDPVLNFPRAIHVGPGVTGFDAEAVDQWLADRATMRDPAPEAAA